jgi:hypothetical protein
MAWFDAFSTINAMKSNLGPAICTKAADEIAPV